MDETDLFGVKGHFKGKSIITTDDLRHYFAVRGHKLKDSTLRWRIYHLRQNRVLLPVKRGVYSLNGKRPFQPALTRRIQKLYSLYAYNYSPLLRCVAWSTEWLHQFMIQQPANHLIILETEKEWTESLFYLLQEKLRNTYLNPSRDTIREYVLGQKEAIIIKPLITRSPTQMVKSEIEIATLEKILVDTFCDKDLFTSYQGSELENIFVNAWKNYSLNLSALMNYAKRRKRAVALVEFLKKSPHQELYKLLSK